MGWLSGSKTYVEEMIGEFEDLVDDIKDVIEEMEGNLSTLKTDTGSVHSKVNGYTDAKGPLTDIYYDKIEDSKINFNDIYLKYQDAIDDLKTKKSRANSVLKQLEEYRRKEKNKDKEYSKSEVYIN